MLPQRVAGQMTNVHVANGHLTDVQLSDRHFTERTFGRTDI